MDLFQIAASLLLLGFFTYFFHTFKNHLKEKKESIFEKS